jgi:hypothetical protein
MSKSICGTHSCSDIDRAKIDAIINQLNGQHMAITGNNPWDFDTQHHGVKLQGSWSERTSTLSVAVTGKNWYVPCSKIWDTIDPLIHHIQSLADLTSGRALSRPGVPDGGNCGTHSYGNIDQTKIDAIITQLKSNGATVSGNNPWDVDTRNHGVKLQGAWSKKTSKLSVAVIDRNWYVPCTKIWDTVDPLIHYIQGLSAEEIPIK